MKRLLSIGLALGSIAFSSARAQYTSGDLMMGFENGSTKSVVIDLGPVELFRTGMPAINLANLNAALVSAFGGTPGTNNNIFATLWAHLNPGDPSNTLYASQPHSNALSSSQQSSRGSNMTSVEGTYNNLFAAQNTKAITMDSSTDGPNTYRAFAGNGVAFQNYITEKQFNLNNFALDRLTPSSGAGQTLGTLLFSFDGSGNLTNATFAPVPEPSTYALMFLGAGVLALFIRRSRFKSVTRDAAV